MLYTLALNIYIYIYRERERERESLVVGELKWLDGWVLERYSITTVSYNTHIYRMAEISIVNIRTLLVVLVFTIKVVTQSCQTLCDPMDYSLPGSSVHGIFPGKSTGVGCHFLLQRIFLTQGLNPGLPNWKQTLYHLSHLGKPFNHLLKWIKHWHLKSVFILFHTQPH